MNESRIDYSIVIPVYKSGEWMDELVNRIRVVMEQETSGHFELLLINDCSPDAITWQAIKSNAEKHTWVRGFNLLYNVGQFRSIVCGMHHARGRYIITMDDDLQHPPEELPKLIHAIKEDEDILCVMGEYGLKRHGLIRNIGSSFHQRIMNRLYGKPAHVRTTSFRIMKKELVDALLACRTAKPIVSSMIFSMTNKVKNVSVNHAPRSQGKSGYSFLKLVATTCDNIINASTFPLRMFSILGFICASVSVILAFVFLFRWLMGGIAVAGFTTQILLIIFFGGMMLVGIGILGEYIARIIAEITGPERFYICATTDKRTADAHDESR